MFTVPGPLATIPGLYQLLKELKVDALLELETLCRWADRKKGETHY